MDKTVSKPARIALFWDESFLWGLLAYRALRAAGLPFDLVRSDDIKRGYLKAYQVLLVPGGWASNKMKALEEEGVSEIKRFVGEGGSYLGICGGAGLATLDCIGLLGVKRKPTRERVPSFSGKIRLTLSPHPIWRGIAPAAPAEDPPAEDHNSPLSAVFQAWWPSQFLVEERELRILARFGEALPDSFSSDLNVGDIREHGDWRQFEDLYRINLDPARLTGGPAVVEGRYGKGRVIVSLVHFDTPDDPNGAGVLKNLCEYLAGQDICNSFPQAGKPRRGDAENSKGHELAGAPCPLPVAPQLISEIEGAVDELIGLGTRNFLWFWRNPMIMQWRRGVRGLEYCTLFVMVKAVSQFLREFGSGTEKNVYCELPVEPAGLPFSDRSFEDALDRVRTLLFPFVEKAKRLLVLERQAMQTIAITYENCEDPDIRMIRSELFSSSKSHGGLFKELIDEIDDLLYTLIKTRKL